MEDWIKGLLTMIVSVGVVGIIGFMIVTWPDFGTEKIIVDSEITNVSYVTENEILFLNLEFESGEKYKVRVRTDVDLTVNSRLILELKRYTTDGEPDKDYWYLEKVIKVP